MSSTVKWIFNHSYQSSGGIDSYNDPSIPISIVKSGTLLNEIVLDLDIGATSTLMSVSTGTAKTNQVCVILSTGEAMISWNYDNVNDSSAMGIAPQISHVIPMTTTDYNVSPLVRVTTASREIRYMDVKNIDSKPINVRAAFVQL